MQVRAILTWRWIQVRCVYYIIHFTMLPHILLRRSFSAFGPRLAGHNKVRPHSTLLITYILLIFNQGDFSGRKLKIKREQTTRKKAFFTQKQIMYVSSVLWWLGMSFISFGSRILPLLSGVRLVSFYCRLRLTPASLNEHSWRFYWS